MSEQGSTEPPADGRRDLAAEEPPAAYPEDVKFWAVLVGISKYQYESMNLRYARRDAEGLYEELTSPRCGFAPERVRLLVDEQATTANLNDALRSFLKGPAREDVVLLYFACHGGPDPDRPRVLYLLTHDTDPNNISGTALPMREIDLSLQENLLAERVVLLADACHSAGVANRRAAPGAAQAVNAFLRKVSQDRELGQIRAGVATLTSAEQSETAEEGEEWGGGHGVFTHFLIQGLRGAADGHGGQPRDGLVSVRELFEYVRESVVRATTRDGKTTQHPSIGTSFFDPRLPLAFTGAEDARLHLEIGRLLIELGHIVDDPGRFEAAAAELRLAARFAQHSGEELPEATAQLGRALLALGRVDEAVQELSRCPAEAAPPEALLYLGVVEARRHDLAAAARALRAFVERAPAHEAAGFAEDYLEWIEASARCRRRALLIGINRYQAESLHELRGCLNDVRLMKETLVERLGFDARDIRELEDERATRAGILGALGDLAREAAPEDVVVVFFSGHSNDGYLRVEGDLYLATFDTVERGGTLACGIGAAELDERMRAIQAWQKLLILDTHPNEGFIRRVRSGGDYLLLLASSPGQTTFEVPAMRPGEPVPAGALTATLAQVLARLDPRSLTYDVLLRAVGAGIRAFGFDQEPLFHGDRRQLVFTREPMHLSLWSFVQRRNRATCAPSEVRALYQQCRRRPAARLRRAYAACAEAFLAQGAPEAAAEAIEIAAAEGGERSPAILLPLGAARALTGRRAAAVEALGEALERLQQPDGALLLGVARLLLAVGDPVRAERGFEQAARADATGEAHFHLGLLRACRGDEPGAQEALRRFLAAAQPGRGPAWMLDRARWLLGEHTPRKHALLIGISRYAFFPYAAAFGAFNDIRRFKEVLLARHGFQTGDVVELLDAAATRAGVLAALQRLAERVVPGDSVVVLYAAGHGAFAPPRGDQTDVKDAFLVHDSAFEGTGFARAITAQELHERLAAIPTPRKTVLLDPGGTELLSLARATPDAYDLFVSASPGESVRERDCEVEGRWIRHGVFCKWLIEQLWSATPAQTLGELAEAVTAGMRTPYHAVSMDYVRSSMAPSGSSDQSATGLQTPVFIGDPARPLFASWSPPLAERGAWVARELARREPVERLVRSLLAALEQAPARAAITLLDGLVRQREQRGDPDPEALLDLGIAYAAVGDFERSIHHLERAAAVLGEPDRAGEGRAGGSPAQLLVAVRYHLGRILLESGRDPSRAVSELSAVVERVPDDARACYHLGAAIQEMVTRQTLVRAEEAFQRYLELGAPLGHVEEVNAFLAERAQGRA